MLTAGDDDWLALVGNLGEARKSWGWLSRVLGREGADPKVSGSFYSGSAPLWGGDMGPHSEDGEGPGQPSVQGREGDHREASAAEERRDLVLPASGGGTGGSGARGDTEVNNTEAEHGRTIYCDATDSGPMRAGHPAARSKGVLAVVGAGRNRPGGGEEMGCGVNDKIGVGGGGGVGRGTERGCGRRGGVSGSERVKWSRVERGGGRMSDPPRQMTGREHGEEGKSSKKPKLRGKESSALIAAVLGWNSITHY